MKVLLANPPGPWLRCRWDIKISKTSMKYYPFPVRLAYATSVLKKNGYNARIIDATAEELTRNQFIGRFKEFMPDLVVWETTASSFEYDLETMKALRKINPNIKVAASGYHATPAYKECIKAGYDYVIVGECDYSILDLARYLNGDIKDFPKGVVSKNRKLLVRPLIDNLDDLPWPERDMLPMRKYNDPKLHGFNVVMITSRSCPWGCNFCTVGVYYGKKSYRMRSAKDVVDEMEFLQKKYRPNELYFDDDNFGVNQKHVAGICRELIRRKTRINWNCMVDAMIPYKLLRLMKAAGCGGITIGAESADDNVLKEMNGKPIKKEYITRFVEHCRKLKIRTHICWVLGMKGSSKESDFETIKFALNLPSDSLQFSICVPYLGTPLYKWCESDGRFFTKDWKNFLGSDKCIMDLPGYTHSEVEEMHKLAGKLWYRRMLRKPNVLFMHLYNIYRYQGFKGLYNVTKKSIKMVK